MPEQTVNNPDGLSAPSPELIRQELARVLNTKTFATSARSSRVLSYVTEKTLAGERDGIKELVLGIDVFERVGDFDPKVDLLRIEIPKGGYVPRFQVRGEESVALLGTRQR